MYTVSVEVVLDFTLRSRCVLPSDFEKLEGARSSARIFLEALTDKVDEDPRVWKPLVRPRLVEIELAPLFCMVTVLGKPEELHQNAA